MTNAYEIRWPPVPGRAIALSIGTVLVPVVLAYLLPGRQGYELLVWLLALVPAFLLAFYRGWRGVAVGMAAGMAVISTGQVVLEVAGRTVQDDPLFLGVLAVYVATGVGVGWLSELLHRERAKTEWLAFTDALTGLANRRQAMFFLEKEFAAARRGRPLAVVFFDLDHLKSINDRAGHAAGDRALKALGQALSEETRDMELSARIGGDEFLSVLEAVTAEDARVFVTRVRQHLERDPQSMEPVTFSAGIALHSPEVVDADHLVEMADRAMYAAKGNGGVAVAPRGRPRNDRADPTT